MAAIIKLKRMQVIEAWDAILFRMFNIVSYLRYIIYFKKYKSIIRRNIKLKNTHQQDRCFIIFGGTSLADVDLTLIENEIVCCVNHFYNTKEYDIVKPNYYFASDTHIFAAQKSRKKDENYIEQIIEKTKGSAKCIFSHKAIPLNIEEDHVFVTCSLHKSTKNNVRSDLASISSNFGSVSMFAINCAIYMGFKEVYLLGYDFPPGNMPHFYKESDVEVQWRDKRNMQNEMYEVCERHWQYSQAQFENHYLSMHAQREGVKVYNCNLNSNVRAFEFRAVNDVLT